MPDGEKAVCAAAGRQRAMVAPEMDGERGKKWVQRVAMGREEGEKSAEAKEGVDGAGEEGRERQQ